MTPFRKPRKPPVAPVRVIYEDGTEEVVPGSRYDRERAKARSARKRAWRIVDRRNEIARARECSKEAAQALAIAEAEHEINDGKVFAAVMVQYHKLASGRS